jgi:hypothetical protein
LRAAAQALVNLARGAGRIFAFRQGRTDIVVGQHIAGANNHSCESPDANLSQLMLSLAYAESLCKEKSVVFRSSNLHLADQCLCRSWQISKSSQKNKISAFDIAQRLKINSVIVVVSSRK